LITDGFLVVDKAAGITSHDVVAIARRALGTKKVGHAGTLDPMATGVLVLGFGNGTRLLQYITDGAKSYLATIVLGASTVTDDAEGEILQERNAAAITDEAIQGELAKMVGAIQQRPSSVSAVKVGGERAYARVRAGEEFELPSREVSISSIDINDIRRIGSKIEVDIEVTCGPGTFIRAIARDCGDRLGVGGHLNKLRRTRVAPFDLSQSFTVDALKAGDFTPLTIAYVSGLTFPIREVGLEEENELSFGRPLSANSTEEITAGLAGDRLIALLSNSEGQARPIAVFAQRQ
jgi:tRNA pseudouridine55 synthase